ncbi:MAG: tryptophan synthase subunit alpha [Francisellaceae bacterium]
MNRFRQKFNEKKQLFVPFFTLGDPGFDRSFEIIKTAIDAGADALELGFAFSDPIADGPLNQRSMMRALHAGMNFDKAILLLKRIRQAYPDLPIGLLLYYNLIYRQGEAAYQKLASADVDAVVCADLPLEEADKHLQFLEKYNVGSVQMVAPNSPDQRVGALFAHSSAYAYVLSGFGTTGVKETVSVETIHRIKHVKALGDTPIIVGFGISKPEHVKAVFDAGADGAIVGSYFTSLIENNLDDIKQVKREIADFIHRVKQ